jgi:hypothetical protein
MTLRGFFLCVPLQKKREIFEIVKYIGMFLRCKLNISKRKMYVVQKLFDAMYRKAFFPFVCILSKQRINDAYRTFYSNSAVVYETFI